jgi:DNA-directed RNA polymerase beta' subunit
MKLHQCGLPKRIALELYQPFIIRQLKQRGFADTIKSAKKMIERRGEQIWDILEEVIHQHPVLLNRAPTLHRMGIQAFEPVLVEGNAIMLHPLACKGFNADFDGDQMAVHLPLSVEAQAEAHTLMMTTNNIFSPANGSPMVGPSQDMVLGNYYLTSMVAGQKGEGSIYKDPFEAMLAYDMGKIALHAKIKVRISKYVVQEGQKANGARSDEKVKPTVVETTVGRCIFNDILPEEMPFYNWTMGQKQLSSVISDCYQISGSQYTVDLLDKIKEQGFRSATLSGLSFGVMDLKIPKKKPEIIDETEKRVKKILKNYQQGVLTEGERYNQVIDAWTNARVAVTNEMMRGLKEDKKDDGSPYLNPIHIMSISGARGSVDQIQQLAGMRALMAKPSGEIIETPIKSNFREGLTVLEYFSSTHGARKGLADTALKTANSGYLTRKLIDVSQNMIVTERDCGTLQGITKSTVARGEQVDIPLSQLIIGRTARDNIRNPITDEMIVRENEVITPEAAAKVEAMGVDAIRVRSPLTCDSPFGVCAKCYGWDMSTGKLVEEGLPVGIIAAQSIGEPGTQLTLRTFHTGGVASRAILEREQRATYAGKIKYREINAVTLKQEDGTTRTVALKRNGEIAILDDKDRELDKFKVPYGAVIRTAENEQVKAGAMLFEWDPHRTPILAEVTGMIRFVDIVEGETIRLEEERKGQAGDKPVVIEHKGDKHPQIMIEEAVGGEVSQSRISNFIEKELEFAYVPTPNLPQDDDTLEKILTFIEDGIMLEFPDPDKPNEKKLHIPRFNKRNKFCSEALSKDDLDSKKEQWQKDATDTQRGIFEKCLRVIKSKDTDWYNKAEQVQDKSFYLPGLYFYRNRKTKVVNHGYVGMAGLRSGKGMYDRIKNSHESPAHKDDSLRVNVQEWIERQEGEAVDGGKILDVHYLPAGARIEVTEGQKVQAGQLLAHQPRATGGTQDITGGLPRVTEVFEARKPKEPAAIAEISGRVELKSDKRKGKMTITIRSESGMEKEHHVPRDRHLNVHTGDLVEAGDTLTDGPLVPHDILRIKGEEALQRYLIGEIQNVYRSQNVNINDKHIEIIASQMMRKVEIESVGDSQFLPGEVVDKFEFRRENMRLNESIKIASAGDSAEVKEGQIIDKAKLATINDKIESIGGEPAKGKKPKSATAKTLLLGITKASLRSDSFIAAASFQQTTKVLTEAALSRSVDKLCGLKENVILGHLIPAGTAFKPYLELKVKHLAEAPLPKEFREEKELETEKEAEARKQAAIKEALGLK